MRLRFRSMLKDWHTRIRHSGALRHELVPLDEPARIPLPDALHLMIPQPSVNVEYLSFRESGQFAARDVAYAERDAALRPFMAYEPSLSAFAKTISERQQHPVDRATLTAVLTEQYAGYGVKAPENLEALRGEDAFSIVTAHQASLFLGPLYYVYKILSAVSLSRQLADVYPEYRFVPTFVLGAEDHDLEEINHVRLSGETITWKTQQTGATGAMSLADLEEALNRVTAKLGQSEAAQHLKALLTRCYRPDRTLGEATAHFVAELFAPYGVVVANLNDRRLKANFSALIKREVVKQASKQLIAETVGELEEIGYAQQAHARDINFFYLQPGRRDRLVHEGDRIRVLDTDVSWSEAELLAEVDAHPERFSPNVVMRPLMQETTLPNLAYVGGGGELAYWLERKAQFEAFGVPYPVLVRRDSAWWISSANRKRLDKLDLRYADLLGDKHALLRRYVTERSEVDLDFGPALAQLEATFTDLSQRAKAVDPTLEKRALAHGVRATQAIEQLQKRLVRTLKKQNADAVVRIGEVRDALLPGGGLQERRDSFMEQYVVYGSHFFDTLLEHFDPLDMRLKVFVEQ